MKRDHPNAVKTRWSARVAGVAGGLALLPGAASAAIFHGETLDKVADVMAIIVLIVVPVTVIVLFWLVHVLPEKIAHKRHHPQLEAIKTLCLLSLVFGGLLWPLAWIWAYSKPVLYKMAYGTDKHPEYFATVPQGGAEAEAPVPAQGASASERDLQRLRVAISDLRSSEDPAALHALRAELLSLERQLADREAIAVARTRKAEVA